VFTISLDTTTMAGENGNGIPRVGTDTVKMGLAQMLKGGVIVSLFIDREEWIFLVAVR
jgi:hypothetical protein